MDRSYAHMQSQQREHHLKRLGELAGKIFAHAELRPTLDGGGGGSGGDAGSDGGRPRSQAVESWDQEMTYLNHERRKYQIYAAAINDPPPHRPDARRPTVVSSSGVSLGASGTSSSMHIPADPSATSATITAASTTLEAAATAGA